MHRALCRVGPGVILAGLNPNVAHAQQQPATSTAATSEAQERAGETVTGDIIVTARKRDETSIAVPVTISAVGSEELQRRAINTLDTLSRAVPQVIISDAAASFQGGTISIRGISSGEENPFSDQAVSFNIDGAQIGRASPRRLAQLDLAQVEVLKGPQALFFGKNSPGGIISIRSADPTDHLEGKLSTGYEVNAHEVRAEGYVSVPLTDTLGLRVAGYGSTMRGWVRNDTPDSSAYRPDHRWNPGTDEYAGRLTLRYDGGSRLSARLKVSYSRSTDNGPLATAERLYCPLGTAQTGAVADDCTLDHHQIKGDLGPSVGASFTEQGPGARFGDGTPYSRNTQFLASLELNYSPSDTLKLTSVTSRYAVDFKSVDNYSLTYAPRQIIGNAARLQVKEIGQEIRLASSFDFPLNFLVGGYYQSSDLTVSLRTDSGVDPASLLRIDDTTQRGHAYSGFGQLIWNITDHLELAGGGRYSYERKTFGGVRRFVPQTVLTPDASWRNFSPEVTLAYRPTGNLTVYGAYKQGFLSGGFNGGAGNFTDPKLFGQTRVKGEEAGVKIRVGRLRGNLGVYDYRISGLQVTTNVPNPAGPGLFFQIVSNAGAATVRGVEADLNWQTPLRGFALRGAIGYNRARYKRFLTTCYTGQTQALGCNLTAFGPVAPGQTGTLQDLAGAQIVRAPDVSGTFGASYDRPVTSGWVLGLSADLTYSGSYWSDTTEEPPSKVHPYAILDATARVFSDRAGLEFAVIGKNLTDKLYVTRTVQVPLSGGPRGGAAPSFLADQYGTVVRGQEILLRVTKTF